jgi:hypothetical protein
MKQAPSWLMFLLSQINETCNEHWIGTWIVIIYNCFKSIEHICPTMYNKFSQHFDEIIQYSIGELKARGLDQWLGLF